MIDIKPITLLRGTHSDTGQTGQGCFMNVIAYLNGEDQITDQSPCVCYVLRHLIIWFNDSIPEARRNILLPYLLRAMGSATDDKTEISRRLRLIVDFSSKQAEYAAESAESAESAKYAKYAAKYAALLEKDFLDLLDQALPKNEYQIFTPAVQVRLNELCALQG